MNKTPDNEMYTDIRFSLIRKKLSDIKRIAIDGINAAQITMLDLDAISDYCDIIDATLDYIEEDMKEAEHASN